MKTCLLRTLSKFVASRKLTILGFGRTDALKERREKGRKGKRAKGERCRGGKKIELGRKKEREEEGANEREEEGPNTTRKKADMADVAGERNAAGTSGRKLGGRVRHGGGRGGRGGRGEDSVYGGREGRRWGSGERSEGGKGGGRGGALPAFKTSRQSTDPL